MDQFQQQNMKSIDIELHQTLDREITDEINNNKTVTENKEQGIIQFKVKKRQTFTLTALDNKKKENEFTLNEKALSQR